MNLSGIPNKFETERLVVRRCTPAHVDQLFEAARESISEVYPYLPWCHPEYTKEESLDWLAFTSEQWNAGDANSFSIFDKQSNQYLGGCGINRIDEHPVANLGYWIRSSEAGRGICTEAAGGLAAFCFQYLGLIRLEIIMSVENLASQKVAENLKAHYEGCLRNRLLLHGSPHDAHLYSLTPP